MKLTNGVGEFWPSCASELDSVFYVGQTTGGPAYFFKVKSSGGEPVRVSDEPTIGHPVLSLDGHLLIMLVALLNGTPVIRIVSPDTGAILEQKMIEPTIDSAHPSGAWMPGNASVAAFDVRTGVANLWSLPIIGGGDEKQLTHFTSGAVFHAAYSPDGKLLAIVHGSEDSDAVLFTSSK